MDHPWEKIYKTEGRVFSEPFPRFREVARDFRKNGCTNILDLGCGNGRHVVQLAKVGFSVTGLDISQTGLRLTRAWLDDEKRDANLILADMRTRLPVRAGAFDGLLSTQVIHHARLAEVRTTIAEIYRILVPGGLAFVSVAGRIHDDTEYVEIEPRTYVPQTGTEAGLPHHIFTEVTLQAEFRDFLIHNVDLRAEGRVLTILAQKPAITGKAQGQVSESFSFNCENRLSPSCADALRPPRASTVQGQTEEGKGRHGGLPLHNGLLLYG
jgi:SAM-dependent methyltransferase